MNYISSYDVYTFLPEFYLFISCCSFLVYGVIINTNKKFGCPLLINSLHLLVFQTFIFTLLLTINYSPFTIFSWNFIFTSNNYIYKLKILILLISVSWLASVFFYVTHEFINSFEYWILATLSILATLFILQVYDFLSMYLAIEFQSLSFYVLTSYKRTSEFSTEAGLKYFVLGAFSSCLLLFGSSLIYSLTGLSNFGDFSKFTSGFYFDNSLITVGILTGLIFILISLLFKLSAAPFHIWSPDVYEGAPTSTTLLLIILPKLSLIVLCIRLFIDTFQSYLFITEKIILFSTLLSLTVGALGAIIQFKWKRFIAYSSISHVGFILLPLVAGTNSSVFFTLFYIIIYIIMMLTTFTWISSVRTCNYLSNYQIRYLQDVNCLSNLNPILSITLVFVLFSMAGIPPLSGFFAKMFVLLNILTNKIYGAAILSILLSCLACFYYIRLIKIMYFSYRRSLPFLYPITKPISLLLACFFYFLCLLFLDLEIVTLFIQATINNEML